MELVEEAFQSEDELLVFTSWDREVALEDPRFLLDSLLTLMEEHLWIML